MTHREVSTGGGDPGTRPNCVTFGPFRFHTFERRLEKDGQSVPLGGRACDALLLLVSSAGEVVGKRELVRHIWPDTNAEEGALRVQINALRKALVGAHAGAHYITNVPGRGYCFVEPVRWAQTAPVPAPALEADESWTRHNLPPRESGVKGREACLQTIMQALSASRLVSIVGPGGVGKTTLAVSVCHDLLTAFDGQIRFVDFATASDPGRVMETLRTALGTAPAGAADPAVRDDLKGRKRLILLDSCETFIGPISAWAARIVAESERVSLLATSREALGVAHERVHRLEALDCAPRSEDLTAAQALAYPAHQLFVERLRASTHDFVLGDDEARQVASICRKADGLPLALTVAAGRVGAFGLAQVEGLLDDPIAMEWPGRRTAPPRHQSLRACLDWSFARLSREEQTMLCELSMFTGVFTLQAAMRLASADVDAIGDVLGALVSKSMVEAYDEPPPRYRLLSVTRSFARMKLAEDGRMESMARRYASYSWGQALAAE